MVKIFHWFFSDLKRKKRFWSKFILCPEKFYTQSNCLQKKEILSVHWISKIKYPQAHFSSRFQLSGRKDGLKNYWLNDFKNKTRSAEILQQSRHKNKSEMKNTNGLRELIILGMTRQRQIDFIKSRDNFYSGIFFAGLSDEQVQQIALFVGRKEKAEKIKS